MNILLMIHSLGHGGSERQLANTALGLDRSRFKPYVASVLEGIAASYDRESEWQDSEAVVRKRLPD